MTKQISRIIMLVAMAGVVAGVAGCKSTCKDGCGSGVAGVCKENQMAGLAAIVCQPMDVTVKEGGIAAFDVKATGTDLSYQWFFNGEPISDEQKNTHGAHEQRLVVSGVTAADLGFYACEIESTDCTGSQVRTSTRSAALGYYELTALSLIPPQHQPMPSGGAGQNLCGPCCGYVNFNNGGALFTPDPGRTSCYCKVRVGASTVYLPNNQYDLVWRVSARERDCATNFSTDQKTFSCSDAKKYAFTVYFRPGFCPKTKADVVLEIQFQ